MDLLETRIARRALGKWLSHALAAFVLALVASTIPAATGAQDLKEYRLGPGDKLGVKVFGHDDLSGEFVVDGTGQIAMPLIGRVTATNQTLQELQDNLTAILDRDFIVDPRVSIEVLNYRPFFILGQVKKPGSYAYVNGLDVRQAVALAGGYTRRAKTSTVTVIRRSPDGNTTLRAWPDSPILPGDTIEVKRRFF
ncbi:MAG: polysaccharide biosynthesis/export family protein [Alphaproteobacteria bacterium]